MARPWRIQFENAIYHVMSRGVGGKQVFLTRGDYVRFLECIERTIEKFGLEIFAFVLMGNHYHLLLRTPQANLSKAMQWLQTSYGVYYNKRHDSRGHVFQGRYKSILVGEEVYWERLSLYIHLNPIRAGMVERLEEYQWSSYTDYISMEKRHKWVLSEEILKRFGGDSKQQRIKYQELIKEVSGKDEDVLDEVRYGLILGSEEFSSWIQGRFLGAKDEVEEELPQRKRMRDSKDREIVEKVFEAAMKEFGVEKSELVGKKKCRPNLCRDVGLYLLHDYTGLNNKMIGELFEVSSTAVTKAARRVNEGMKKQKEIREKVEKVVCSAFKV